MKDKSKLTAIILSILAIIVVIMNLIPKEEKNEEHDIKIVTNYIDFYTVDSCLNRAISYISSNDSDSVYKLVNDNYKKNNNINKSNVIDKFDKIEENSIFVSRKMFYEETSDNINKYYVYGYLEKNEINDYDIIQNKDVVYQYYVIYLDNSNETFSIEPYNGEIFKGE